MALTNSLLNPPTVSTRFRKKFSVGLQDLKNLGAFTTGTITLASLPAGAILMANRVKHSTAVAGTSFSAATARLSFNGTSLGAGALDVFAAVGVTVGTHEITGVTPIVGKVGEATDLLMLLTSTGGNLAATTAGSIEGYVDYIVLL